MSTVGEMGEAPGWDAIDGALRSIYGDVEPTHWGTMFRWRMGGPDPLDGVSAYPRLDPVPHWHYVSYGMSELYGKESNDPEESGWGFELTFRLARDPAETEAPIWVAQFLQNLARYVFRSGNGFAAGDVIDANGPIALEREDSVIRAVAFAVDSELDVISTPNGRVRFVQAVGLAVDEYEAAQGWDTGALLGVLGPRLPLFVTDIDRGSLLADPDIASAVHEGRARDGSSTGAMLVQSVGYTREGDRSRLAISSGDAQRIARMLAARLPYGRGLLVHSPDRVVGFLPGDRFDIAPGDDDMIEITVPPDAVNDLLDALRGVPSLPGLGIELEERAARPDDDGVEPLRGYDESDMEDLFASAPGDRVLGLVEPDLGEGVDAGSGVRRGSWSADLFYGDPLALRGPFVWVRTEQPTAEFPQRSLSLMLLSEHRRLVAHAWLGDRDFTVPPEPAEVPMMVGTRLLTAEALVEGDLVWAMRAAVDDTAVVTVIGRGVDIGRVRLEPVGDLGPYQERLSELYERLHAALDNRPDPPNPAVEGDALEALRDVIKEQGPDLADDILEGTADVSDEPLAPPPLNTDRRTGMFGDIITRAFEQAVRELRRANDDADRQTAEWWVSSASEHVWHLNNGSFFDQAPDLRERAVEETCRYFAYDEKVSSQQAQDAWEALRDHRYDVPHLDDIAAHDDRQRQLEAAWQEEWRTWVAARSAAG